LPFSVREGINIFLAGFIPTENMRFRDEGLDFKVAGDSKKDTEELVNEAFSGAEYSYPELTKTLGDFKVHVEAGKF
jgi:ATP-binding cassette subfamily E protein 1